MDTRNSFAQWRSGSGRSYLAARSATLWRAASGIPVVTDRKVGAKPIGSTTTKRVTAAEMRYSSGMAARLAYAVAFRAVRDVLVLDEIFAVGDAGFKDRCQARYRELHRAGHSMLLVSHEPRTITSFCDRALLLEEGRIVMAGDPDEVAEAYLSLLTGTPPVPTPEPLAR